MMAKEKQLPNTNIHQRSSETRISTRLINNHQADEHKKRNPKETTAKNHQVTKSPKIHTPNNFHTHNFNPTKSKEWLWIVFLAQLVLFLHLIFTNVTSRQSHGGLQWYLGAIMMGKMGGLDLPPFPNRRKWRIFPLEGTLLTRKFSWNPSINFRGICYVSFQGGR